MSRHGSLPKTWSEVYERLAYALASEADAREWIAEALEALWGVMDPVQLERGRRGLALQKASGVLLAIEDSGEDFVFGLDVRRRMVELIARYFNGVGVEGPPWSVAPNEEQPSYAEYMAAADF